jgi:hypothetical protein
MNKLIITTYLICFFIGNIYSKDTVLNKLENSVQFSKHATDTNSFYISFISYTIGLTKEEHISLIKEVLFKKGFSEYAKIKLGDDSLVKSVLRRIEKLCIFDVCQMEYIILYKDLALLLGQQEDSFKKNDSKLET